MYRTRGFQIDLTRHHISYLRQVRAVQREVYNWAVRMMLWNPQLSKFDLQKEFTKKRQATPHMQEEVRAYQDTAVRQAWDAADASRRRGKGRIKFRTGKHGGRKAIVCDTAPQYVDNFSVALPGIGPIRLCAEQPYQYPSHWLDGARSWKIVDVTPRLWKIRARDRVYRLYVTYKLPDPAPRSEGMIVGIDRGVTNPTVVCKTDGETAEFVCYDTAVSFRKNARWNDTSDSVVKRRNRQSCSTERIVKRRENFNRKNANARDYWEWVLAKEVCHGTMMICMESLDLEAMTRNGGAYKKLLNRGMRSIRHGAIKRKIRIVAERLGITILEVNPMYTSQRCHQCSHTAKENRDGETFHCTMCRTVDNADANAAANIVQLGTGMKVPAGEGIALTKRVMGRPRRPPHLGVRVLDVLRQRENQACNRPEGTSSVSKHHRGHA